MGEEEAGWRRGKRGEEEAGVEEAGVEEREEGGGG